MNQVSNIYYQVIFTSTEIHETPGLKCFHDEQNVNIILEFLLFHSLTFHKYYFSIFLLQNGHVSDILQKRC